MFILFEFELNKTQIFTTFVCFKINKHFALFIFIFSKAEWEVLGLVEKLEIGKALEERVVAGVLFLTSQTASADIPLRDHLFATNLLKHPLALHIPRRVVIEPAESGVELLLGLEAGVLHILQREPSPLLVLEQFGQLNERIFLHQLPLLNRLFLCAWIRHGLAVCNQRQKQIGILVRSKTSNCFAFFERLSLRLRLLTGRRWWFRIDYDSAGYTWSVHMWIFLIEINFFFLV